MATDARTPSAGLMGRQIPLQSGRLHCWYEIARESPLDTAERGACGLLEVARWVQIVLLDDGGLTVVRPTISGQVCDAVADALRGAESGMVTARILPPGRPTIASILVSDSSDDVRIELDRHGLRSAEPP